MDNWWLFAGYKFKSTGGVVPDPLERPVKVPPKCGMNIHPVIRDTLLHLCVRSGQTAMAEQMIKLGAKVDLKNGLGQTAKDIAPQRMRSLFDHEVLPAG